MPEDRAQAFLQMIRRSERGRLKIYLGYGPGVGKTYQMLSEAHRLKKEGIDVVVGLVETHGRPETAKLVDGLEVIPRRKVEYHGIIVEEMDVDAVLARQPQVAVVDELAHTNVPGSRNPKRYQDVQDILAAGIHVLSAMNVQHLESLYNTVEQLIGVKVRERIPDSVLAEADQIVNIDLAAEDLQARLRDGKIYPTERVASSLENFFTASNLEHLRELTLRELASQLDFKRREMHHDAGDSIRPDGAPDQIMVCLSRAGPTVPGCCDLPRAWPAGSIATGTPSMCRRRRKNRPSSTPARSGCWPTRSRWPISSARRSSRSRARTSPTRSCVSP